MGSERVVVVVEKNKVMRRVEYEEEPWVNRLIYTYISSLKFALATIAVLKY